MTLQIKALAKIQILLICLLVFNSNIHLPCFTTLKEAFSVAPQTVQLAFILNPFIAALTSIGYGVLADKGNPRHLLILTTLIFLSGTVLCIFSHTIMAFFSGRFLQGLGDAGIVVASSVILGFYYQGADFARIQAVSNIFSCSAWALAPFIGLSVCCSWGWRVNFLVVFSLMLGAVMVLIFCIVQEKKSQEGYPSNPQREKTTSFTLCPAFLYLSLAHSIPLGIFTAVALSSPFIFIEHYGYSTPTYAFMNFIIIQANIIGSFVYLFFLKKRTLEWALRWGVRTYALFICLCIVYKCVPFYSSSFLFLFCSSLEAFALPFFMSSYSAKIVELYPNNLGKSLSLMTVIRNICSSTLAFMGSYALSGSILCFMTFILVSALISMFFIWKTKVAFL